MIENIDQKTKDRVNKAIDNVRLIASRSKRAQVLDATQRAEVVVDILNEFRRYLNWCVTMGLEEDTHTTFKHNTTTVERVGFGVAELSTVYNNLSHSKQVSYREEYKQAWMVLTDMTDYLLKKINQGRDNAAS